MSASPETSDAAVRAKTGKHWREWFEQLDAAGASGWNHAAIARHLGDSYGLDPWWRQAVAVSYERARGLRDKHERPDGFEIQRQRTLPVALDAAWRAWTDRKTRQRWLPDAAEAAVRSTRDERPDRRQVRLDWVDGRTRVLLGMVPAADDRSTVGVQHSKLPDREAAERMKAYWGERLDALRTLLEQA